MKRILLAALVLSLNFSAAAFAQETCESKAVSREGKPLAGAAKTSFLKKCKRDTCQVKAVGSNGRALAGAAKKSFMQKCEREPSMTPKSGYRFSEKIMLQQKAERDDLDARQGRARPRRHGSKGNTFFQSRFMSTTVQPRLTASSQALSRRPTGELRS